MREDEEPKTYALRFHRRARADMAEARARIIQQVDTPHGRRWQADLMEAISTLATYPGRCAVARENRLFRREIRQHGYHNYRILFTIVEVTEDAPFVFILHVRHVARRPMTRKEAREIEDED